MKEFLTLSLGVILLFFYSCKFELKENRTLSNADAQKQIASMLDSFHAAAARADYNRYFSFFSQDASFIGTDATEHWTKDRFAVWAKPYFDRGKAWSFTSIERHIYVDSAMQWAWFDELLRTQMKICRGSGVVVWDGQNWKIRQYVLSMTIPNSKTNQVTQLKTDEEDSLMNRISLTK